MSTRAGTRRWGPALTNQALCCSHLDILLAAQRRVTPANNQYKGAMTSPLCYTDTAATSIARRSNIPEAIYKGEALVSLTLQPPAAMLPAGAKAPQLLAFARSSHNKPPRGWYMGPCATQSRTPLLKPRHSGDETPLSVLARHHDYLSHDGSRGEAASTNP
jgi:hypothetical protein